MSRACLAAIVAKESPNWEKIELSRPISSAVLSLAITQAIEEISVTSSHEFKINTSIYNMKYNKYWIQCIYTQKKLCLPIL